MGFDPSMSNWGVVEGQYDPHATKLTLSRGYVIQPNKELVEHKSVRTNVKDLQKANVLALHLKNALSYWRPQAIFVEVPVGSQNSRAMCSYGMCIGLLGFLKLHNSSLFVVTPTEVKLALTNAKGASKQDMIDAAVALHPEVPWPLKNGEVIKGKAEHIADAIGAVHAGINSQDFKNLLSLAIGA